MSETMFGKPSAPGPFALFHRPLARKRAQEHLLLQSTILRNISESVIVTDLQQHIIYWNEGATTLFGYSAEEMLGRTPAVLYPEWDQARLSADLATIGAGRPYRGEWQGRRKDGTPLWIDITTTPLVDGTGAAIGFIG